MLRNDRGRHRHAGDAILDLFSGSHTLAAEVTDNEYQSRSEGLLPSKQSWFYKRELI